MKTPQQRLSESEAKHEPISAKTFEDELREADEYIKAHPELVDPNRPSLQQIADQRKSKRPR